MPTDNMAIAQHLEDISQLMQIDGEDQYKALAFTNAASTIRGLNKPINLGVKIPGIGKSILTVIVEFALSGTSSRYMDLVNRWPSEILSLQIVQGIGPKRARLLYEAGFKNFEVLLATARMGLLEEKLQKNVLEAAEKRRLPLATASEIANNICGSLSNLKSLKSLTICGSIRRRLPTCKDIDIIGELHENNSFGSKELIFKQFQALGETIVSGDKKASIKIAHGTHNVQVDLWLVESWHVGAAIQYATGSKAHNINLRAMAKGKGFLVSEYGIFALNADGSAGRRLGGEKESDIYSILGLEMPEPQNRIA